MGLRFISSAKTLTTLVLKLNNVLGSNSSCQTYGQKASDCRNRSWSARCCRQLQPSWYGLWCLYKQRMWSVNVSMFSVWRWWGATVHAVETGTRAPQGCGRCSLERGWMTLKPSYDALGSAVGPTLSNYCSWVPKRLVKNHVSSNLEKKKDACQITSLLSCRWWFLMLMVFHSMWLMKKSNCWGRSCRSRTDTQHHYDKR